MCAIQIVFCISDWIGFLTGPFLYFADYLNWIATTLIYFISMFFFVFIFLYFTDYLNWIATTLETEEGRTVTVESIGCV